MKGRLVVMLKEPHPGRVKTRLGRDLGMVGAAWWFRHQTARLLRRLQDPRWEIVLAVTPDREGMRSRIWPAQLTRVPQGAGHLGDRMARVMRTLAPGPVCVIGGDIPGVTSAKVARAFAALGAQEAVFGPAPDGGYWLIGVRHPGRMPSAFLQDVRWSSAYALQDSVASLGRRSVALVDTLRDVDTLADLHALRGKPIH